MGCPARAQGAAQSPGMGRHASQPASETDPLWEGPTGTLSPFSCTPLPGPGRPAPRPSGQRGAGAPSRQRPVSTPPQRASPGLGRSAPRLPPTLPLPVDPSSWLQVWPCPCTPGGHQTSLGTHEAQPQAGGVRHRLGPPGPGRTGCPRRNLKAQRRGVPSLGWPQEACKPEGLRGAGPCQGPALGVRRGGCPQRL